MAVIALAINVLVMMAVYLISYKPLNTTFIAAMLTVVGYSINNTIVIFDRIRENNKVMGTSATFEEKTDASIKQTLRRSLFTTITTLLTIGMVYILGVTSIKNFALPLIVGIISGAFSSICLAGNLHFIFKNKKAK